jgi:hypothetical protein
MHQTLLLVCKYKLWCRKPEHNQPNQRSRVFILHTNTSGTEDPGSVLSRVTVGVHVYMHRLETFIPVCLVNLDCKLMDSEHITYFIGMQKPYTCMYTNGRMHVHTYIPSVLFKILKQ